tara:strand:- start:1122 stop:1493 length:372 start_codon:yes stop_codon:yes gene_type:complete
MKTSALKQTITHDVQRLPKDTIIAKEDLRFLLNRQIDDISDANKNLYAARCDAFYEDPLNLPCGLYDVEYVTPSNNKGTISGVEANSLADAIFRAPVKLAYGTDYDPSEFIMYSVRLTGIRES